MTAPFTSNPNTYQSAMVEQWNLKVTINRLSAELADARAEVERVLVERDTVRHELARADVSLRDARAELDQVRGLLDGVTDGIADGVGAFTTAYREACAYLDSITQAAAQEEPTQ